MHYERTHYDVLGLPETASTRDVSKAFLTGAKGPWYEPMSPWPQRREEAYSVLADPVRRGDGIFQGVPRQAHRLQRSGLGSDLGCPLWHSGFLLGTIYLTHLVSGVKIGV